MSQFLHVKDKFGNDMYFGDTGSVLLPPSPNIQDYAEQLGRIRDVELRSDDVIVVGYPKSGNNWTHHMISMLVAGTTDLPPIGPDNFALIDMFGGGLNLPPPDKPRVFFSHLPFRHLPRDVVEKRVKVVYVTRNPKDVLVSAYCHLSKVKPPQGYEGTWPQFFEVMLEEGYSYGIIFDHLKDWEKEIKAHPQLSIFRCRYEDTKQNRFLDTNRSRQLCQEIVNACRLSNMPTSRKLCENMVKDVFQWKEGMTFDKFYRKGTVGDWKNWFTVAQNEQFDAVYKSKMAGYQPTFVYE